MVSGWFAFRGGGDSESREAGGLHTVEHRWVPRFKLPVVNCPSWAVFPVKDSYVAEFREARRVTKGVAATKKL